MATATEQISLTWKGRLEKWINASRLNMSLSAAFVRYLIGFVFPAAAIPKLRDPQSFLRAVYNYHVLRPPFGRPVAFIVPYLELTLAIAFLLKISESGALIVSAVLFALFAGVQMIAVVRELAVPCGCGFIAGRTVSLWTVLQVVLLALSAFGAFWTLRPRVCRENGGKATPPGQ